MNDEQIKDTYHLYGVEAVLTKPVNLNGLRPIIEENFYWFLLLLVFLLV